LQLTGSPTFKAIRWAVEEKHVHIISISFGFPNADKSLEPIRRAILEAHAADVLIFAATGNKGKGDAIEFPACLDEVISVGSTDGEHKKSSFVPTKLGPGKRLCAIGEALEAAWIKPTTADSNRIAHCTQQRKAGTSYATPIAAGIAATIMDLIWSDRAEHSHQCQILRTNRGMMAVLERMVERGEGDTYDYLEPWKYLSAQFYADVEALGVHILGVLRTVYNPSL